MIRILLQNCHYNHNNYGEINRGDAAWMIGTLEALRSFIPDAEFVTFMQYSKSFSVRHRLEVIENWLFTSKSFSLLCLVKSSLRLLQCALWAILHKYLHINVNILVNSRQLKEYRKATIVLDMSSRLNSENFGIISVIEHCKDILMPSLLGKPVVIYAQSPGPFRNRLTSWLAKLALNRASLITLREETGKSYLDEIGISKPPVYITADPGFLLEPASQARIQDIFSKEGIIRSDKPLIGIAVPEGELFGSGVFAADVGWSGYKKNAVRFFYNIALYCLPDMIFQRLMRLARRTGYYSNLKSQFRDKTINHLAQIADYLTGRFNATVFLISQNIIPGGQDAEGILDGRVTAKAIHRLVSNRGKVIPIIGDYTAEELKGIIGQCDLLISMKTHAWIAAVSQYVPALAIGSSKFLGFLKMLGQEEWLCDRISTDEVIAKIEYAWIRREEIKEELKSRLDTVREKALLNAKLVKELLDTGNE